MRQKSPSKTLALRVGGLLCLAIGIGLSGCSLFKIDSEKPETDLLKKSILDSTELSSADPQYDSSGKPIPAKTRLAGGLTLGDTGNLAFTAESLSAVVEEMVESERWNSLRNIVALYPDVTTKILWGEGQNQLSSSQREVLARAMDLQWTMGEVDSWQSFVSQQYNHGNPGNYLENRNRFLAFLQVNDTNSAFSIKLSKSVEKTNSQIAKAESLRLEGIAHLMNEDYENSIKSLSRARALQEKSQPIQASHTGLLLGEAYRHAEELDQWQASWLKAIEVQSQWAVERGLMDPAFWNKAAFLRPVSAQWPADVIGRLEHSLRNENLEFGFSESSIDEAVVWATIGIQSLKRHESQNSILAFKKSEALVNGVSLREELQMQQALAMIDGGQQGPASAILLRLGSQPSLLGDRAKAILATLKLQNGSIAQGMNLLQSAIKTSSQWPIHERLRAQADYGLAYLMRGREEQGIGLLNYVYDEFLKLQSYEDASQCLANIATYYEKTDQKAKHRIALKKLQSLEIR
jgi:tetratricopeptide (TPR) repeat protein